MEHTKQTSNLNELFYVEFEKGQTDFITSEKLKSISEDLKKRDFEGKIVSLKKFKPLAQQKDEISDLHFNLRTNTQLLEALIDRAYKLEENSSDYVDLMNNISHFIHSNIIAIAQRKLSELNSVLELEENKD